MPIQNVQISGLTCGACVKLIERRVQRLSGVVEVRVSPDGKTTLRGEREILPADIQQALAGTPYKLVD